MGLLKNLLRGADKAYDAMETVEHQVFRDRRFGRAEQLAATGDPNTAVITGIRRRLNDTTTETDVRLEWFAPDLRVGAVHYGSAVPLLIRLGSTVAVRADGDAVVLDADAMVEAPDPPSDAGRRARRVPDQGVDDRALDMRVLSRIRRWTPQEATVESFERVTLFGMPSENWTIVVRLPDGRRATVSRDAVPRYAQWFVAPGAVVPVVTDPKRDGRAQVDWPELAERAAVSGGVWQEPPPAGSIAADLLSASAYVDESSSAAMGDSAADEVDLSPSAESAESIEGITLEHCAFVDASLIAARVPPKEQDAYATAELEVPEGRWTIIRSAWQARMMSDWRVGAAYGAAFEAAQKELKRR